MEMPVSAPAQPIIGVPSEAPNLGEGEKTPETQRVLPLSIHVGGCRLREPIHDLAPYKNTKEAVSIWVRDKLRHSTSSGISIGYTDPTWTKVRNLVQAPVRGLNEYHGHF